MQYSKEQKIKMYESLPEDIKEAIISVELSEKLQNISNKFSLMLDQASELSDEVGLFMIGLTKQKDFVRNIQTRLEIDSDKANAIAKDINTEIFDSIRASLQKIQEQNESSETQTIAESVKTPPSPPSNLPIEKAGGFTIEPNIPKSSIQYEEKRLNRDEILKQIEDTPVTLADHLLSTTVKNPVQVENKKPYTTDPYREPIK